MRYVAGMKAISYLSCILLCICCTVQVFVDGYSYDLVESSAPSYAWYSLATNSSGEFIVATANAGVYVSFNHGYTWAQSSSLILEVVVSSATCDHLYAIGYGTVYSSIDYGQTWYDISSNYTSETIVGVATSSSGKIVYAISDYFYGFLMYSYDYGATFQFSPAISVYQEIVCSANGQYVLVNIIDTLYVSNNFGMNFTSTSISAISITISESGQFMFAGTNEGVIYISADYGTSWSPSTSPVAYWSLIVSSGAGQYVAAANQNGAIYTSQNYGASWNMTILQPTWTALCLSSSGANLTASQGFGGIYYNSIAMSSQPTSQPSSYPSFEAVLDTSVTVVSSSSSNVYSFTGLNCNSGTAYLTASIVVSYLSVSSKGYLNITAGSGSSQIVVSSDCAPHSTCGSTICAINIDVSSAVLCDDGGSLTLHANTVNVQEQTGLQSICTYQGTQNVQYVLEYTLSSNPQPTLAPTHSPTQPKSGNIIVNASPNTPFYVIVAVILMYASMGVFLVRLKDKASQFDLKLTTTCFDFAMIGYHFCSEIFYIAVLFTEEATTVGAIIVVIRLLGIAPAAYYMLITLGPKNYSHKYGELLDKKMLFKNATFFVSILMLMCFEQTMVRYLPWKRNEFVVFARGFPDQKLFVLSNRFKVCQLLAALIVQIVVLVEKYSSLHQNDISFALVVIYLIASIIMFAMSALSNFIRIRNIAASEESKKSIVDRDSKSINPLASGQERLTEMGALRSAEALRITQLEERELLLKSEINSLKEKDDVMTNQLSLAHNEIESLKGKFLTWEEKFNELSSISKV